MSERAAGELSIVLHTHMPYVEGFGTWPFGEEWLWEAMATCYLPLLELLDAKPDLLTLSCTPVLLDQLEAPGVGERFEQFISGVRRSTHRVDIEGLTRSGALDLAAELERAALDYERALERFHALDRDLAGALARHAAWTSSATHAVLALCATDAGARLQIEVGVASHRRRSTTSWGGGFWLPECAYAPWLDPLLAQSGVRASCLDLTDLYGRGAPEHLQPLRSSGGPIFVPIDRATIELVWSDDGYPADGRYRDYHRHTIHHHRPWDNAGRPYDHTQALELAAAHAAQFVASVKTRVSGGGLAVCALDTELLGHWWYEGLAWLEAVIDEALRQDLRLAPLDEALTRHPAAPAGELPVCSWGTPRALSTWGGERVAGIAFAARDAELCAVAAAPRGGIDAAAVRELLALQASDWAFMESAASAADYPRERASAHARAFASALAAVGSGAAGEHRDARNIAAQGSVAPLLEP
ncbi:MAG: 1,4-alpha-glucan branching protein domain-containing protein [Solirubrobacteraceae bacterium]